MLDAESAGGSVVDCKEFCNDSRSDSGKVQDSELLCRASFMPLEPIELCLD